MEVEYEIPQNGSHELDMERTIQELKKRKKELEEAINQLRQSSSQNLVPDSQLSAQDTLSILTKAHQDAAEAEPFLPSPVSVLPSLLAIRRAQRTTAESTEYANAQETLREEVERQIEAERLELRDHQTLKTALENRIQALRKGLENKREKTQEEKAKERIAELKEEKKRWDSQTAGLLKELEWFIEEHLGPMLAAEELGGPVVGQLTEIDPDDLGVGFSAHGKLKKAKDKPDNDKHQRRIDDIWGPRDQEGQPANKRKRERDETTAAVEEMRELIEQLMNKLVESGGDNSAVYVRIPRESATARFLVRSKVATFHPKDAQMLRLIDFGRELDD
ncbi:hypothetical protein QBC38DRAFT_20294 [Podospora fimiseda]|uniref:Uncharacterized protein n=1 Tax=Podospora fimiseda TaxID=252190 RepID=A0AAN7BXB8_9PEZI|nr:hypothetical protein QBC38DRAFT_20294 [Podospora fimiseda]